MKISGVFQGLVPSNPDQSQETLVSLLEPSLVEDLDGDSRAPFDCDIKVLIPRRSKRTFDRVSSVRPVAVN